jgi:hypothetical protein
MAMAVLPVPGFPARRMARPPIWIILLCDSDHCEDTFSKKLWMMALSADEFNIIEKSRSIQFKFKLLR